MENVAIEQEGHYRIEKILLMSYNFHREVAIDFSESNPILNKIDIEYEVTQKEGDRNFGVIVTLSVDGIQEEGSESQHTVYRHVVKMAGLFEKVGNPGLDEESFKRINAPAIIYPFIREHITSNSIKAGCGALLLPTVNFTAMNIEKD